jgi:peroxiredoxin
MSDKQIVLSWRTDSKTMDAKLKNLSLFFILIFTMDFLSTAMVKAELEPGRPLPVFILPSLDSQVVDLRDYLGKIVIIHLWKCQWNQCRAEIPHLLKVKEKYSPDKVVILSINVLDKKGRVEAEVEKYEMNYTVLVGRGENLTSEYKIKKLPHLFILDQKGVIYTSERFLKEEEIIKVLDKLIDQQ